jgi:NTE family protein
VPSAMHPADNQSMPFRQLFTRPASLLLATTALLAACSTAPPQPLPSTPPAKAEPIPVVLVPKIRPKIGLALGGGAARGFAHVGVIAVLEEAGFKPDFVVGTSAGSLVAALYASGKTPAQLQQIAMDMEEATLTDWTLPLFGRGVLKGEALGNYVNAQIRHKLIESMAIPLGIVATDLHTGQGVMFQRGDTGAAVRASSAVPSVFAPVKIGAAEYVDGGLVSPVPVKFARQMGAQLVIAVDISSAPEGNLADSQLQILLQTFAIMGKSINTWELREADLVVRPALVGVKSADFASKRRSMEAGRAAMQAALPALRVALEKLSR